MSRYVIVRLIQGSITLLLASVIIFMLARMTGDPLSVILPETASEEDRAAMANYLGLDRPLPTQYLIFLTNVIKGDLGVSIHFRRPVSTLIIERAPATIRLAVASILVSLVIALPLGILAAVRRDRWPDSLAKAAALLGQSMPNFWLGILLIQCFAVWLGLLPSGGYGNGAIVYWILPAFTMGWFIAAGIMRLTRSSMLDVLDTDYVRLARIKGVPERIVIWKHALRNALIPIVTFSSVVFVNMLAGTIITETVFAWPGLGRLSYEAVMYADFPLIRGLIVAFVGLYIIVNLLIDILYVYIEPRIRYVNA